MKEFHSNVLYDYICYPTADYLDTDLPSRLYEGLKEIVDVCEGDTDTLESVLDDIIKFEDSL